MQRLLRGVACERPRPRTGPGPFLQLLAAQHVVTDPHRDLLGAAAIDTGTTGDDAGQPQVLAGALRNVGIDLVDGWQQRTTVAPGRTGCVAWLAGCAAAAAV